MEGIVVGLFDIVGLIDGFVADRRSARGLIIVVAVGIDALVHEVSGDGQSIAPVGPARPPATKRSARDWNSCGLRRRARPERRREYSSKLRNCRNSSETETAPAAITLRSIQPLMYLPVVTTRSAAMSPIGRFSIKLPRPLVLPPVVCEASTAAAPSKVWSLGGLVTNLMVPPMDPAPYRVPCGSAQYLGAIEIEKVGIDDRAAVERHRGRR